jgi:hypothetical protein
LDTELLHTIEMDCSRDGGDLLEHRRWACERMLDELCWSHFTAKETVSLWALLAGVNSRRLADGPAPFTGLRIAR